MQLALRLMLLGGRPFDPVAALFGAGERGGLWPFTLGTVWQDIARTIPVTTAGQLIAVADDVSGNGNHLLQSVSTKRFAWQADGIWLADGLDDFMVSNTNVNLSGSNQVSVFASGGTSAASTAILCELTSIASSTSGGFNIAYIVTQTWQFASRGSTAQVIAIGAVGSAPVPQNAVLTGQGTISPSLVTLRQNGAAFGTAGTSSQGVGNYANATLYVGSRAGSSLFWSGRGGPVIARSGLTSTALIAQTESWINSKFRAY